MRRPELLNNRRGRLTAPPKALEMRPTVAHRVRPPYGATACWDGPWIIVVAGAERVSPERHHEPSRQVWAVAGPPPRQHGERSESYAPASGNRAQSAFVSHTW
jgi:hypothetical protein